MKLQRMVASLAAPALLSGCAVLADAEPVRFSSDLVPALRTQCATCHLTGKEPGGMALHPKAAYANLVGVPSVQSKLLRVKPGAPDESYLLRKLEGSHLDVGGSGARMPFAAAPLDAATLDKFRAWIAAGAPDN